MSYLFFSEVSPVQAAVVSLQQHMPTPQRNKIFFDLNVLVTLSKNC